MLNKNKKMLNPASNIAILAVSTLIAVLLSNATVNEITEKSGLIEKLMYYAFHESIMPGARPAFILIGLWGVWLVFYFAYQPKMEAKIEEIISLRNENTDLNDRLRNEAGILLGKYSDLSKFKANDILEVNLKRYADGKNLIQAAQLYKYSLTSDNGNTRIKVKYNGGYVKEGININCLMQTYYTVPTFVIECISNVTKLWEHLNLQVNSSVEEFIVDDIYNQIDSISINSINRIKETMINKHNIQGLTEDDCDLYSAASTIIKSMYVDDSDAINEEMARMISEIFSYNNLSELDFDNQEAAITSNIQDDEKRLRNTKRTGILESILAQTFSIFQHEGHNNKNGRVYISKCISLDNQKYVLMLTACSSISDKVKWKEKLIDLSTELEEILVGAFQKN